MLAPILLEMASLLKMNPVAFTLLVANLDTFAFVIPTQRGGPHWLDSFGADLRWKPPAIMPPVFLGNLPLADSSMLHEASCRLEKNEDAPRYTV